MRATMSQRVLSRQVRNAGSHASGGCGKIGPIFSPRGKDAGKMTYTKERAAAAAANARPYVERALRDEELRDNIRNAYTSARAVYEELSSRRKGVRRRVAARGRQGSPGRDPERDRRAPERVPAASRTRRRPHRSPHTPPSTACSWCSGSWSASCSTRSRARRCGARSAASCSAAGTTSSTRGTAARPRA